MFRLQDAHYTLECDRSSDSIDEKRLPGTLSGFRGVVARAAAGSQFEATGIQLRRASVPNSVANGGSWSGLLGALYKSVVFDCGAQVTWIDGSRTATRS